jgi:hypothetical protein
MRYGRSMGSLLIETGFGMSEKRSAAKDNSMPPLYKAKSAPAGAHEFFKKFRKTFWGKELEGRGGPPWGCLTRSLRRRR